MADVTYVISIRDDTSGKGSTPGVASTDSNTGVAPTTSGESASPKSSGFNISKSAGVMMGVAAVKKVGNRVATTYISQIGVRTGNVTLQEKLAYDKGVAMRVIGIGTTLIVGVATGNPLAIAAGVGSAISWGVDIAVAQEQLNLERAVEHIGIQQANIRAGAGGDRSGRSTY